MTRRSHSVYRGRHAIRPLSRACDCIATFADDRLVVDATGCPSKGALADSPACRATVVTALDGRDTTAVLTRTDETVCRYGEGATALLVAASRFAELMVVHDDALARRAHYDPLGVARAATTRPDPIARIAAETGLAVGAHRVVNYDDALPSRTHHTPTANATHVCGWALLTAMLHEVADAGELPPEELHARYHQQLRTAIHDAGIEAVAKTAGVDRDALTALDAGDTGDAGGADSVGGAGDASDPPELTVDDAASILATREDTPDSETITAELRDHLLLGMTTAVLDVEALESEIGGELDAREIQQKIEGRLPMTLYELALIHGTIEAHKP